MLIKNDSPYIIIFQSLNQQLIESDITIREAICPNCLPFPIADVICGHCNETYQTKLPFRHDQEFIVQNHKLECYHCGKIERISYITKKVSPISKKE